MIWMSEVEVKEIINSLSIDDIMLEYGSGGSTLEFSKYVKKYISIEHDKEWYDKIKSQIKPNVDIYHIEANKPRSFPYVKYEEFEDYILFIHKISSNINFNKVLIDGRARVWCAENVIPYIDKSSIVYIHDWPEREFYHTVLKWYELIKVVDKLAVLRKK